MFWIVIGVGVAASIVFGVYWIVTAPVRLERKATDTLILYAALQEVSLTWGSRDAEPLKLTDEHHWARERLIADSPRWDMNPTGSTAFPFEATIIIPYVRYATVYHESKDEAAADDNFYRTTDNSMFHAEPSSLTGVLTDYDYRSYVIIEVICDSSGRWREKSRKTLRDIRESQLETEEARRKAE